MPFKIVKLGSVWKIRKTYSIGDKRKNHYINKQFKTRDSAIKVAKGYVRFRRGLPVVDYKNNIVRAAV